MSRARGTSWRKGREADGEKGGWEGSEPHGIHHTGRRGRTDSDPALALEELPCDHPLQSSGCLPE